jgi:putative transposase
LPGQEICGSDRPRSAHPHHHWKLLSPERKRRAVKACQARFGASERFTCRALSQPRSTQRRQSRPVPTAEERLRVELRSFSKAKARHGYRRAAVHLARRGFAANTKKVHRIWRDENLQVRVRKRKRVRGTSTIRQVRASRPNEVWALDFQFDATTDGRALKMLNATDEFTREWIVMRIDRRCDADQLLVELDRAVMDRGAPSYLRMDNGPEFIAAALRDWCRFTGTGTVFIEPGSPWQNAFVESLNARVRDEFLNGNDFYTLMEAKVLAEDFWMQYNNERPHSSLGYMTPAEFARKWSTKHEPVGLS